MLSSLSRLSVGESGGVIRDSASILTCKKEKKKNVNGGFWIYVDGLYRNLHMHLLDKITRD